MSRAAGTSDSTEAHALRHRANRRMLSRPLRNYSQRPMTVPRNTITDVAGLRVGHAGDARLASGVSVVLFDEPVVASVDVRGGGPGTRETAMLDPAQTVQGVDAIALSGGSAFGLDAASGVQAYLAEQGRGFAVREARVPIVPQAILFDLLNGGD
jgi:L-aminopeptidase/D-esterase-like protein